MSVRTVEERWDALKPFLNQQTQHTAVGEYMRWFSDMIDQNLHNELFLREYQPIIEANRDQPRVFASVVMRTQGRRPEALREALLSLYAQDFHDFEVLLIGHKLNKEQRRLVDTILDEQDPSFRAQIRFLPLDKGNRTTPLNYGFAHALGEYIMILDDDDIVMETWMSDYYAASQKGAGTLLHLSSFSQDWCVVDTRYGDQGLRSTSVAKPLHVYQFNVMEELRSNNCPTLGLGFPSYAFQQWGIIFDETLTTTEDWDCLMRTALVCGVTDGEGVDAIYRMWVNAESSATIHNSDEWLKNYQNIQEKFARMPIILPKGYAPQVRELVDLQARETPAIQKERADYIVRLEKDVQEHVGYIAHLEKDMRELREYVGRLEADFVWLRDHGTGKIAAVPGLYLRAKHLAGRVYRKVRRLGGRILRKLGLLK